MEKEESKAIIFLSEKAAIVSYYLVYLLKLMQNLWFIQGLGLGAEEVLFKLSVWVSGDDFCSCSFQHNAFQE